MGNAYEIYALRYATMSRTPHMNFINPDPHDTSAQDLDYFVWLIRGQGRDILVDTGDAADRLRDGIYVLRIDDALVVKRIALNPVGRRITVQSDNPAYPDWPDCGPSDIKPIGRVIWSGRRIV